MDGRRSPPGDGDGDATPTRDSPDVFDDEFEVWDGLGDGFGYAGEHAAHARAEPVRTVSAHYAPLAHHSTPGALRQSLSRSSTRKSRGYPENPFHSPEDGEAADLDRTASVRSQSTTYAPGDVAHRSASSSSSHHFARSGSPRVGTAGPAHPYAMYPQGTTLPRTPSTLTASTARPPPGRGSSEDASPRRPYAMYTQHVAEDDGDDDGDGDDDSAPLNPVPMGFPGHGHGQLFQRRMGPDGEDQDIIGADGHMEQLPPYSRYPEEQKIPLLAAPAALHSRGPVAGSDPTMPLMHDVPDLPPGAREPRSMTDASRLARSDTRSSRLSDPALEQMRSDASLLSGSTRKSWREKSWKEKRKTRMCGCIPFWWILLATGVVVFIVAVIGGVLGGFFSSQKRDGASFLSPDNVVTVTSLYDASTIAAPPSMAPSVGTFSLPLGPAEATQTACLPDPSQASAWDCDIGGPPAAALVVGPAPGSTGPNGASLIYTSGDTTLSYGLQGWSMETQFGQFLTVQDNDDVGLGPAYYFQQFYDKVVVLPEDCLSPDGASNSKRDFRLPPGWLQQKYTSPLASDKPWMCVWNNTFIEGFIYVTRTVAPTTSTGTTTQPASSPSSSSSSSPSSAPSTTAPAATATQPAQDSIMTTTLTFPSTTVTFTGAPSVTPAWSYGGGFYGQKHPARQNAMSAIPYMIKIEERRLPDNDVQPYCQQVQILDNGEWNWVTDPASGDIVRINLTETDPDYSAYQVAGIAGSRSRRQNVSGGCHCQWMAGL